MLRFVPCADELRPDVTVLRNYYDGVGSKERHYRDARRAFGDSGDLAVDRKDERKLGVPRGALSDEIEMPQLDDIVAPELEADRLRHTESVDVEDPAADAELCYVLDHRDPLESDGLEVRCEVLRTTRVTLPELETCVRQRTRELGPLEQRPRGGEQNPDVSTAQPLECLHPLTGDFGVRLGLTESFARRVEGNPDFFVQRLEIREPALSSGDALRNHDEESAWGAPRERRDQSGVAGTWKARQVYARAGRRKRRHRSREFGECLDG